MDVSKGHSQRADDRTDELKQLNRSIFRPVIVFNKDGKRAARDAKVQERYDEERLERERAMTDVRETQNRLGRAQTYGRDDDEEGGGGSGRFKKPAGVRKEQRKRYQFEETASDEELEDELDDNLDEISDVTKRLKALGAAMGQELDAQNDRIGKIEEKTVGLDGRIYRNTERVRSKTTESAIQADSRYSSRRSSRRYPFGTFASAQLLGRDYGTGIGFRLASTLVVSCLSFFYVFISRMRHSFWSSM